MHRDEALSILKKHCSDDVVEHCVAVSETAVKIAGKIKENGYDMDIDFVEIASLLHDLGRAKTHGIKHGVRGAEIIRELGREKGYDKDQIMKISRVCETHIGAGLTKEDAEEFGLPVKDYLPETLEEKVIAHADNIVFGTRVGSITETIEKLEKKLGRGHPSIKRISQLSRFIEGISRS
ncbi:MAG: TIGR00295 family protein [Candidatus Altiarchaeales archaeon WOR_SM1_79]|nr:MAG: TIGR00295 family protein [Candidatus Altiarchaeales archaeon WOR_SM1_79]